MSQSRKGEGKEWEEEEEEEEEMGKGGQCRPIVWVYIVCLLDFISFHVLYNSLQELREEVKSLMHTGLQTEIQYMLLENNV